MEFLNTFLTTYSVFTKAKFVLDTITQFYYTRKPSMRIASDNVFSENMRLSWGGSREKLRWGSSPDVSTEVTKQGISGKRSSSDVISDIVLLLTFCGTLDSN